MPWTSALWWALAACASEPRPLVDLSLWRAVDADLDPFDDAPEGAVCPSTSFLVEFSPEPALEVDTGQCNYLTLTQPALDDLGAGEWLTMLAGHSALTADAPAQAHVVLQLGDQVLLEEWVDIPSDPGELRVERQAQVWTPQGTPVWLHLHNHGENSWSFPALIGGGEP